MRGEKTVNRKVTSPPGSPEAKPDSSRGDVASPQSTPHSRGKATSGNSLGYLLAMNAMYVLRSFNLNGKTREMFLLKGRLKQKGSQSQIQLM